MSKHTNAAEHEQYLLKGKVRVGIGKKVFEVKIGDTVLIPERVRNWYEAEEKKDSSFSVLCQTRRTGLNYLTIRVKKAS